MSDCKEKFISSVSTALVGNFTQSQIEMVINEIIKELGNYELKNRETALMSFVDVNDGIMKRFCASLLIEGKSEGTIYQYRRTAERLFETVQKHFTQIGVYDIRYFLACEKQRGLSNTSLENTRANLSAFFQWMTNEEIIPANPCAKIKPIKCAEKVKIPYSTIDLDKLRIACKTKKERALVEFLLATGIRVSELAAMKVNDIDWNNLSVIVMKGKGDKQRTTYMTDLAKTHLIAYLEERKENGDYLFYNSKHNPLGDNGVRHILNNLGERANVNNVHPHRFRRTFASGLAARGMDIQEIKKLLGHSDINTTMEYIYTSDVQVQNSYRRYIA